MGSPTRVAVDTSDVEGRGTGRGLPHDYLVVVGAPTHAFSLSRPATRQDAVRQGGRPDAAVTGVREWLAVLPTGTDLRPGSSPSSTPASSQVRRLPVAASPRAFHLLERLGLLDGLRPTGFLVTDIQGDLVPGELEEPRCGDARLPPRAGVRLAGNRASR